MLGPPDYCPSCGSAVTAVDAPVAYFCASCDDYVFHEPSPSARVAVVDGDRVLLVEIADEARLADPPYEVESEWMTPGGHVEVGEQPAVAAARELDEETGLAVESDALELFDAVARQPVEGAHGVILLYAVDRSEATGAPDAASDASDARFWSPADLADADAQYRDLYAEPDEYRELSGLIDRARAAIDESDE